MRTTVINGVGRRYLGSHEGDGFGVRERAGDAAAQLPHETTQQVTDYTRV